LPIFIREGETSMGQICCKCGKNDTEEKIVEGFCLSCYALEFPLIISFPEKQLNITACKVCGDLMYHSKWRQVYDSPADIIHEILDGYIKKAKKAKGTKLMLVSDFGNPSNDVASKHPLKVIFEGSHNAEVPPYQQEMDLDLVINIGVCERCAKFNRGYFESIVQVRSDRRDINEVEQKFISELIKTKREESIGGNRMAYIAKFVDQTRGGIDLYIGSEHFAKSIAYFLAENLAASIDYSTKLKSVKDGKPVYLSTYCVRVPYFEVGDVVEYQHEPHQVIRFNFSRVEIFNLKTRDHKTLSHKESHPDYLKIIKKKVNLPKFIIMALQPPNVSLMNSVSFETIDIDSNFIFEDHADGDEIIMADLPNGLFECFDI